MSRPRWPFGLVVAAGLLLALALQASDSRHWKTPFLGGDLVLLLLTLPLLALLLWRVLSAALASWSGLDVPSACRLEALTLLPCFLVAGYLLQVRWPVFSAGSGLTVAAGFLVAVANGWVFWHRQPRRLSPRALAERGWEALRVAAAEFRHPLALVVLVLLLADVRLLHLSADPPVDLGPSGGAWTDPGEWAHNARNKILYGRWVWDEVNFMYVGPLANLCFYLVFLLLGVGYAQVGLVSVVFSLATLPVFYLSLKESMGRGGALLTTLLLGGNYLYITYNRVGLVETPAIFFQVLTLYCGQRGTRDPRVFALAGAFSLVPLAVKMQMTYIFPAALLSVFLWTLRRSDQPEGRWSLRSLWPLGYFLGGAVAAGLVLAALWIIPYRDQILWRINNERRLHVFAETLPDLLHNIYFNPFFGYFYDLGSRVLLLLSGVFFFRVLLRLLRRDAVPFPQIFALWWFVGGYAYLAISQYRPLRYYASLIPPMTILAGAALLGLWRARAAARLPGPLSVWVAAAGLFAAAVAAIQYWYASLAAAQRGLPLLLYPIAEKELVILAAGVALLASALGIRFVGPRLPRLTGRLPAWAPPALAGLLVVLFFVAEARSYLDWKLTRGYKLVSISRQLGTTLPQGSVIAGIYAPILVLENRHQGLAIWERYGNWEGDPLARFGVTHVVLMTYIDEIGYYRRRFPEAMGRARLLDEWTLWKTRVSLYELPRRG